MTSTNEQGLEHIATVLGADPYDERSGPFYSNRDLKELDALEPDDKLFVLRKVRRAPPVPA